MSLRLHSKYGVNPTIPTCFYCCKSKNMLILLGAASKRLTGHDEAPMRGPVFDKEPCDECKKLLEQGVMLIECRDGSKGDNPYRTGRLWVLREEAVRRMGFGDSRIYFIEESAAKQMGLHDQPATETAT